MSTTQNTYTTLSRALLPPLIIALIMWIVYTIDTRYTLNLYTFGTLPREANGLTGIFTSPLLHSAENNLHILENTFAFLFFGTFLFYFYRTIAYRVLIVNWVITGLLVWLFAGKAYHIGMSGVIYAIAFFLLLSTSLRKHRQLAALNALIIFLYGSIFWGLFPILPNVSWESHLYGALTGVLTALYFRKTSPTEVIAQAPIEDDPNDDLEDAWWKTGVLKEQTNEEKQENTIFNYYYKPKEDKKDA